MNTDFTYRQAGASDLDQLKSLGKESYSEFSSVLTPENWEKMNAFLENEETYQSLIRQGAVFVCENDSDIIGMIYLVPSGNPTALFQEDWCYIRFLGVNPKFRGKGIGKQLTALCLDHARETQEKYIALHTGEFMKSARVIYQKMGFRRIKELTYLGKTYWIYLLDLA